MVVRCGVVQIRKLTRTLDDGPGTMFLLDLPAGGKFYKPATPAPVTAEGIANLLEFFEAGALEAQQVSS